MPGFAGQMTLGQAAGGRPRGVQGQRRAQKPTWNNPRPRPGRGPRPQPPQSLGMVGGNMGPQMAQGRFGRPQFGQLGRPATGFPVGQGMQQVLGNRGFTGFQPPAPSPQPMLQGSGGWGMAGGNMGPQRPPQPQPTFPRPPQPMLQGSGGWGMAGGNMLGMGAPAPRPTQPQPLMPGGWGMSGGNMGGYR